MIKEFFNYLYIHKVAALTTTLIVIIFVAFTGNLVYDSMYNNVNEKASAFKFEKEKIYVTIKGKINKPGIYKIDSDKRLVELINLAGGAVDGADLSNIDQTKNLTDGEVVVIGEPEVTPEPAKTEKGLININTADNALLCELYGVGTKTAQKIIEFREKNGAFTSINQLLSNKLVNKKVFEDIKGKICVK